MIVIDVDSSHEFCILVYVRVQNEGSRSASLNTVSYKYVRKYISYGIRLHYYASPLMFTDTVC